MAQAQTNSQMENDESAPRVADEDTAWRVLENQALVKIAGPDAVIFLQRQTTNNIALVTESFSVTTSLTEPNARLIEVFDVFDAGDPNSLFALPFSQNAPRLADYLQKKVFFMDQVEVSLTPDIAIINLEGQNIQEVLKKIGVTCPDFSLGQLAIIPLSNPEQPGIVYIRRGLIAEFGVRMIGPTNEMKTYTALLRAICPELSEQDWENLRVAAKSPKSGHEISSDYTPLEAGLAWTVSDSKGCYTGQEVIARQITYDKVTKILVRVHSETYIPVGSIVMANGRNCGTITSTAFSTAHIGLAILNKSCLETETVLVAIIGEREVPISISD